jgi:hypothetical protein
MQAKIDVFFRNLWVSPALPEEDISSNLHYMKQL